ncbi:MAG: alpha/beta fold hydrolase [Oligoflexus sp.]|nr:alpha/beta fold hydrolase [Oligoflexus sp.]
MSNILLLPWFQLIILMGSIALGSRLEASEKLKSCQTHNGTWLQCPPVKEEISASFTFKKAAKVSKSKAPLVMLAGGPGQGATEAFLPMSQLLTDLNNNYDLIFFDPRGTAKPHFLACPMKSSIDLTPLSDRAALLKDAGHCVETLGKTMDLNLFRTDLSVSDLEKIRIDMGYDKLSLYAVSYGTRLALRYATLYPDRVEKIILEGVLPPEALIGQDTNYLEPVLKKISDRCWQTASCKEAYGDPWFNYQKLMGDFKNEQTVQVPHPRSGEIQSVRLQSAMIQSMLLSLFYSEFDHTMVPAILYKAARGNYGPLIAAGFTSSRTSEFEGLYYAVACAEDVPFYDEKKLDQRGKELQDICKNFPFKTVDKTFHNPIHGDWPMLLLSGELDPVTAPTLLTQFKTNFTNLSHIIVPGKGHNVYYLNCVAKEIRYFLSDSKTKEKKPLPCENASLPFLLPEPKP